MRKNIVEKVMKFNNLQMSYDDFKKIVDAMEGEIVMPAPRNQFSIQEEYWEWRKIEKREAFPEMYWSPAKFEANIGTIGSEACNAYMARVDIWNEIRDSLDATLISTLPTKAQKAYAESQLNGTFNGKE